MRSFTCQLLALTHIKERLDLIVSTTQGEGGGQSYYADLDRFCNYVIDADMKEIQIEGGLKDAHTSGLPQSVVQRLVDWLKGIYIYTYIYIYIYI
jgi:hypothetical protein